MLRGRKPEDGQVISCHLAESEYAADGRRMVLGHRASAFSATSPSASISSTTYPIRAEVLQILCGNVNLPLLGKIWLSAVNTPGAVFRGVHQATTTVQRQRHFREVHGGQRRAVIRNANQFSADFQTDVFLRLLREPPICGVRITLSNSHSGEVNGSLLSGRFRQGKTSIYAPPDVFVASARRTKPGYLPPYRAALISRPASSGQSLLRPSCFWWRRFQYVQTEPHRSYSAIQTDAAPELHYRAADFIFSIS